MARWSSWAALPVVLALGCGDTGQVNADETSTTGPTGPSTSAAASATTRPGPTTSPDDGPSGSTDSAQTTTTSTGLTTGSDSSSSSQSTSSSDSGGESSVSGSESSSSSSGGSSSGSGGAAGPPGLCGLTCLAPADCPGDPADWICAAGFCEFVGVYPPCEPTRCDDLGLGLYCSTLGGIDACLVGCMVDADCAVLAAGLTCIGVDDNGDTYCADLPCGGLAPGDPCDVGGDLFGVCDGTECVCTDDMQCTAPDFACNN